MDEYIERIFQYTGKYEKYKSDAIGLYSAYSNHFIGFNDKIKKPLYHLPVETASKYLSIGIPRIRKARKLLFELRMIESVHAVDYDGKVRTYVSLKSN